LDLSKKLATNLTISLFGIKLHISYFIINFTKMNPIENQARDYIKDKESHENLDQSDLDLLNAYVELEFRNFIKDQELTDDNRNQIQEDFNKKIDEIVDSSKEKAIFQAIIDLNFELNDLQTQVYLDSLQATTLENQSEFSIRQKIDSKFRLYNNVSIDNIATEITKLNPDKQNEIISLLSIWDIKKFQILVAPNDHSKVLRDWLFWSKTFDAFKSYVNQNSTTNLSTSQTNNPWISNAPSSNIPWSSPDVQSSAPNRNTTNPSNTPPIWASNPEIQNRPTETIPTLTEVRDLSEKQKITDKGFATPEFSRWKIQNDSQWNFYAQINADINWEKYDITRDNLLKFDNEWNLIQWQTIKTTNKEREPIYFVQENQIKFLTRYSDWMYLTPDSVTWITATPEQQRIDFDYQATEFSILEWNRVEYQFDDDLGYQALNKNPRLKRIMDEIIDSEDWKKDISARKYKINLSPNDGLARIILDIYDKDSTNQQAKRLQNKKWTISVDDIKRCFPYYQRGWGLDNERRRIAIILNRAEQRDLTNFAYDAESYGEQYEEKIQTAQKFSQVIEHLDSENILKSLCDYNLDWQLSVIEWRTQLRQKFLTEKWWRYPWWREDYRKYRAERREKNRDYKRSQEWIWDAGTIFWPQLYNEIQRAVSVLDVKLKYEPDTLKEYCKKYNLPEDTQLTWENIVITNIVRNISWISSNQTMEQALNRVPANQWNKSKLLEMAKNYTWVEWLENNWNFQPLFAKAIQQLNWSSSIISPDLYDNLAWVERINTDYNRYSMIESQLDEYLSRHPEDSLKFKSDWFTDTKHTFITWLMSVLDNLEIIASPSFAHLNKSRDKEKYKHKIENEFTKRLIGWWLTIMDDQSVWLNLSTWRKWFSEDWKFQREWKTWAWVMYNLEEQKLTAIVGVWWDTARQYNYDRVVEWRLDDIRSAKYIWLSADAYAWSGLDLQNPNIGWIAKVEIDRKQNPKQAIEQMNRQYRDISNWIFYLPTNIDAKHLQNSKSLQDYLMQRLNILKDQAKEPIKTFINNNEWFLKWNIKNIADYFDKKWIFAMLNNMPNEFAWDKKRNAINNLMQVLQTWIVDSWRDYMYDQLHGKVSVTKIWAWVGIWFSTIDWINLGIPFPTLSFDISTWRKNYVSSAAGKYMDQQIIRNAEIQWYTDQFNPENKSDLKVYAEYITARYNNLPWLQVQEKDWKLEFTYEDPNWWDKKIWDILNIRCKLDQKVLENVTFDWTKLIIWNVWDLWIFSSADGQWVRNFLIIWQRWTIDSNDNPNTFILRPPHPPLDYQWEPKDIQAIQVERSWYKSRSREDIKNHLDQNFRSESISINTNIESVKTEIMWQIVQVWSDLFINWLDGRSSLSPFPHTWTLSFQKDSRWLKISYDPQPSEKLEIKYQFNPTQIITISNTPESALSTPSYTKLDNLFSYPDIYSLFSDPQIVRNLSRLRDQNINKFADFLYKAWADIDDTWYIDEWEYNQSASILKELLWQNYEPIRQILGWNDIQKKALVINTMKWIFATQEWVTNYNTLKSIVASRWEVYKNLNWPHSKFPNLQDDYRFKILSKFETSSNRNNLSQEIEDGLFGYTAFYRRWPNQWRRLSLTAPWTTKVLWWVMEKFSSWDQETAKKWFIENFEKNKVDLSIVAKSINDKLPNWIQDLSDANIIDLLKWESLDIWGKVIKLDSEFLFYLLWECANESIWIKIKWLEISTKETPWDTPIVISSWDPENYSWEIIPEDNYVGWINISSRNLSVPMVPWAYQHDVWISAMWRSRFKDPTEPWIKPPNPELPSDDDGAPWIWIWP